MQEFVLLIQSSKPDEVEMKPVFDLARHSARIAISTRILVLALLVPLITGFDYQETQPPPSSRIADASSTLTEQESQHGAYRPDGTGYNWRRDNSSVQVTLAATDSVPAPGKAKAEPGAAKPESSAAKPEPGSSKPERATVLDWETGAGKSYLIPAIEVPVFLTLLNIRNRFTYEEGGDYNSNLSTTWEHLRHQDWVIDTDPFNTNQFGHPYQGSIMYGMARSTGLNFWESSLYSNVGSFLWEVAGETPSPSFNDLVTTGTSGSLLGEALFRMSALVLNASGDRPDFWHELGAAIISPTTALNRLAFGERFKPIYATHDPATFWRIRLGAVLGGNAEQAATADFAMSYGLPGKVGYSYKRPLDYFDFEISGLSTSQNPVGFVFLRGLLLGKPYDAGENYRGIWGLYGSYDYISPGEFRVSSTAVSLGTTGQYWVAPGVALQGSFLGGLGFGAAGITPAQANIRRDYHYGVTPQLTLALRLLFGDRAVLETVGRGYIVTGSGSDNATGSERIGRGVVNLNVRVIGRHGLGVQYVVSGRDAHYGNLPSQHQKDDTVSLVYTFTGDSHFGAVGWQQHNQ